MYRSDFNDECEFAIGSSVIVIWMLLRVVRQFRLYLRVFRIAV